MQDNFNIEDYRVFILSKIEKRFYKKSSLTIEEVLDYCTQFILTVKDLFPNKNQSTTSEKLRNIFGSALKDKPASVSINTYFLFQYGYIYCNVCNSVLPIDLYYKSKNTWHGHKHYCIECQKVIRNNEDSQKYIRNNRDKYNSYLAKYRASKLQAAPPWLTQEHLSTMQALYAEAKNSGLEVDHIVPLQGKNVCGLHVPWNLQLLTRQQNASKSNKIDSYY